MKPHSVLFRLVANVALFASLVLLACGFVFSQTEKPLPHGTVERIKVHGKSLEGNLEGDSPDRDVSVYLPPSYEKQKHRRYPVVYLLHGYMDNDDNWFGAKHIFINAPAAIDAALAAGSREMIFVMPSAHTVYYGSMYSNSVTTGDWEDYIAHDLVSYIDAHYRTIPDRMSRGLGGHSMGGYGTIRLAMKHPEVFSSIYWLSACCLSGNPWDKQSPAMIKAESVHSAADLAKADFGTRATIAESAAWSPDPKNPPLFFDIPWLDGKLQPQVAAKWDANAPLAMIDQYVTSLRELHAIAGDVGTKDGLMASNEELDHILTAYGIAHTFETYEGTHISGIQDRVEKKVVPFFSNNLSFGRTGR
jgi:S-formylglutathione hydrolase